MHAIEHQLERLGGGLADLIHHIGVALVASLVESGRELASRNAALRKSGKADDIEWLDGEPDDRETR